MIIHLDPPRRPPQGLWVAVAVYAELAGFLYINDNPALISSKDLEHLAHSAKIILGDSEDYNEAQLFIGWGVIPTRFTMLTGDEAWTTLDLVEFDDLLRR